MSKKVFFSYSQDTDDLKIMEELNPHLLNYSKKGLIEILDRNKLNLAIGDPEGVKKEMSTAQLAVQFISVDYLNDDQCIQLLQTAQENKITILPILLRECDWESDNTIKQLGDLIFPDKDTPVAKFLLQESNKDEILTKLANKLKSKIFPELAHVEMKKGSGLFSYILSGLVILCGIVGVYLIRNMEGQNKFVFIGIIITMTILLCLVSLRDVFFPTHYKINKI